MELFLFGTTRVSLLQRVTSTMNQYFRHFRALSLTLMRLISKLEIYAGQQSDSTHEDNQVVAYE